jgi:hypothetical protein
MWKCSECGEYNNEPSLIDEDVDFESRLFPWLDDPDTP